MKTLTITPHEFKSRFGRAIITRVYSGKKGCMCGCMGNYSDNVQTMGAAIRKMLRHDEFGIDIDETGKLIHAFKDTKTRRNVIYFQE